MYIIYTLCIQCIQFRHSVWKWYKAEGGRMIKIIVWMIMCIVQPHPSPSGVPGLVMVLNAVTRCSKMFQVHISISPGFQASLVFQFIFWPRIIGVCGAAIPADDPQPWQYFDHRAQAIILLCKPSSILHVSACQCKIVSATCLNLSAQRWRWSLQHHGGERMEYAVCTCLYDSSGVNSGQWTQEKQGRPRNQNHDRILEKHSEAKSPRAQFLESDSKVSVKSGNAGHMID